MTKNNNEKYVKLDNELADINRQTFNLRMRLCTAIHDMVMEIAEGKNYVDFSDEDEEVFVSYDGGNHSEYASALSTIARKCYAVTVEGRKTFEVDLVYEEDGYSEARMLFEDVCSVYDAVRHLYDEYVMNHDGEV